MRVRGSMARGKCKLGNVRRVVEAPEMVLWTWPRPGICRRQRRVRSAGHRDVAGRAGLIVRITALACTAGLKYSCARLPLVADNNSEVSWVVPTRVIRPKPL